MTTLTKQYQSALRKLKNKKGKVKLKFYNNGEGRFALVYRNEFLTWVCIPVVKALVKNNFAKIAGEYLP
jgi:hypothetical protein